MGECLWKSNIKHIRFKNRNGGAKKGKLTHLQLVESPLGVVTLQKVDIDNYADGYYQFLFKTYHEKLKKLEANEVFSKLPVLKAGAAHKDHERYFKIMWNGYKNKIDSVAKNKQDKSKEMHEYLENLTKHLASGKNQAGVLWVHGDDGEKYADFLFSDELGTRSNKKSKDTHKNIFDVISTDFAYTYTTTGNNPNSFIYGLYDFASYHEPEEEAFKK